MPTYIKPEIHERTYFTDFGPAGKYFTFKAVGGRETESTWFITLNMEQPRTKTEWGEYFRACAEAADSLPDALANEPVQRRPAPDSQSQTG
jgi:hypothetical protein